jgi:hypothetical protein
MPAPFSPVTGDLGLLAGEGGGVGQKEETHTVQSELILTVLSLIFCHFKPASSLDFGI